MDTRRRTRMAFSSVPSKEKLRDGTSSMPNVMTPISLRKRMNASLDGLLRQMTAKDRFGLDLSLWDDPSRLTIHRMSCLGSSTSIDRRVDENPEISVAPASSVWSSKQSCTLVSECCPCCIWRKSRQLQFIGHRQGALLARTCCSSYQCIDFEASRPQG
ncbi:hypothetical protein PISMIDRAFT_234936 [Pisolithus microcarpus 441]|uniref:Uncharacterized protein n=1 Tax=Pisolithus microcarpus 441 TaxID=765257 RepID=A0A0C9ZBA2_9AGAM|nr:hypothetical protein PISMIDRAFT_234936 [Pisolithus microcarpus 441]